MSRISNILLIRCLSTINFTHFEKPFLICSLLAQKSRPLTLHTKHLALFLCNTKITHAESILKLLTFHTSKHFSFSMISLAKQTLVTIISHFLMKTISHSRCKVPAYLLARQDRHKHMSKYHSPVNFTSFGSNQPYGKAGHCCSRHQGFDPSGINQHGQTSQTALDPRNFD